MGWNLPWRSTLVLLIAGISSLFADDIYIPSAPPSQCTYLFTDPHKSTVFPPPNDEVLEEYWDSYRGNWGRRYLSRIHRDSLPYRFTSSFILWNNEIPQSLMDLPVIESAWDPRSLSSSGALGIWQFMNNSIPVSFVQDRWRDDRMDIHLSAEAAASKFHFNLNKTGGDWLLALAGYNCGINLITRSMTAHPPGDYWHFRELGILPEQTEHYIPRFLVVHYLNARKVRYNLDIHWEKSPYWIPLPPRETLFLPALADQLSMDLETLQQGNAELWDWLTPPDQGDYRIKIPHDRLNQFGESQSDDQWLVMNHRGSADNLMIENSWRAIPFYTVEHGDTLWSIAEENQIEVQMIIEANHLGEESTIFPGMVLFLP